MRGRRSPFRGGSLRRFGAAAARFVALTGNSGSYVYTADKAALDLTGDLTAIACVAPTSWTPATAQVLVAKRASGQWSFQMSISTSAGNPLLSFFWTENGTTSKVVSQSLTGLVTNGQPTWLAASLDVDAGASNHLVTFSQSAGATSTPLGSVSWSTIGSGSAAATTTTSVFSGSATLTIGSITGGTASLLTGNAYQAALISGGLAGSVVAHWTPGVGTDAYGNTWIEP